MRVLVLVLFVCVAGLLGCSDKRPAAGDYEILLRLPPSLRSPAHRYRNFMRAASRLVLRFNGAENCLREYSFRPLRWDRIRLNLSDLVEKVEQIEVEIWARGARGDHRPYPVLRGMKRFGNESGQTISLRLTVSAREFD